jgi:3-keto-disaccharide hydrolase
MMTGAAYDDDHNFETILDGTSLHGWEMCGPGTFVLENKMIMSQGGMGLLWYTEKKFRDFILRVDWKTTRREDNSGVFVRFADPDDDPWIAVNTGYEVQIYDAVPQDGNSTHRTGAIYDFAPPSTTFASNEPGEWNAFEIHVIGQSYTVILNNKRIITQFKGNRRLEGYIGLQNHDANSKVYFGKIRLREL